MQHQLKICLLQLDESEDPADEVALDARFASLNSKKFRFEISVSKASCLADIRYQAIINSAQAL
jgi:hypothetical protein